MPRVRNWGWDVFVSFSSLLFLLQDTSTKCCELPYFEQRTDSVTQPWKKQEKKEEESPEMPSDIFFIWVFASRVVK